MVSSAARYDHFDIAPDLFSSVSTVIYRADSILSHYSEIIKVIKSNFIPFRYFYLGK